MKGTPVTRSRGGTKVTIDVDTSGLQAALAQMEQNLHANARAICQAGAQVYYDAVRENVARLGKRTGKLYDSVFQYYDQKRSDANHVTYIVSWNHQKAPHGINVEYGHLIRYRQYQDEHGHIRVMRQPGSEGMTKPAKNAPQSVKDKYWVPLPGGPQQVAAHSFLRRAAYSSFVKQEAMAAMVREINYRINDGTYA